MENKELKHTEISSADKLIEWLKMRIEVSHSSFDYIKFALTEYATLKNKALQEENERLKKVIEGLAPKSEMSKVVDPNGYATTAAKILHALNLVIGEHVNEFAMPVIIQIIKNNINQKQENGK